MQMNTLVQQFQAFPVGQAPRIINLLFKNVKQGGNFWDEDVKILKAFVKARSANVTKDVLVQVIQGLPHLTTMAKLDLIAVFVDSPDWGENAPCLEDSVEMICALGLEKCYKEISLAFTDATDLGKDMVVSWKTCETIMKQGPSWADWSAWVDVLNCMVVVEITSCDKIMEQIFVECYHDGIDDGKIFGHIVSLVLDMGWEDGMYILSGCLRQECLADVPMADKYAFFMKFFGF